MSITVNVASATPSVGTVILLTDKDRLNSETITKLLFEAIRLEDWTAIARLSKQLRQVALRNVTIDNNMSIIGEIIDYILNNVEIDDYITVKSVCDSSALDEKSFCNKNCYGQYHAPTNKVRAAIQVLIDKGDFIAEYASAGGRPICVFKRIK